MGRNLGYEPFRLDLPLHDGSSFPAATNQVQRSRRGRRSGGWSGIRPTGCLGAASASVSWLAPRRRHGVCLGTLVCRQKCPQYPEVIARGRETPLARHRHGGHSLGAGGRVSWGGATSRNHSIGPERCAGLLNGLLGHLMRGRSGRIEDEIE